MNVTDAVQAFLTGRAVHCTSETLGHYRHLLNHWLSWRSPRFPGAQVNAVAIDEFRQFLHYLRWEHIPHQNNPHRPAATTVGLDAESLQAYYRVLRAFWRFCAQEEWLTAAQQQYFAGQRIPPIKGTETIRAIYAENDYERLLTACEEEDQEAQYRNQAILRLLRDTGMRVSELCSLDDDNVSLNLRRAIIRGKGGKKRYVFWHPPTAQVLTQYLAVRRGSPGGPLLRGISSRNNGNALTPDSVRSWLKRLAEQAGVTLPKGSPVHSFRHTFAHDALDSGLDIAHVSQLMGHASLEMTMRYVREFPDGLQHLHGRINPGR
jgi:site-specific recombinase XerD